MKVVGLEYLVAFGEGISDDQEFSSGGDDRYLRGFAGLAHGEIIFAGERVCPARGEGGHVERGAHARPSAGDLGAAAKGSALMGMRGQAGQAGDGAATSRGRKQSIGGIGGCHRICHADTITAMKSKDFVIYNRIQGGPTGGNSNWRSAITVDNARRRRAIKR